MSIQKPNKFFFLALFFAVAIGLFYVSKRGLRPEVAKVKISSPDRKVLATIALFADSHNSNNNLQLATSIAKDIGVDFAGHLGDMTNVGTQSELISAKKVLDSSGLSYFTVPGDHEYYISEWNGTRGIENYTKVFARRYGKKIIKGNLGAIRLLFLDNASTTGGVDETQMFWLQDQITQAKFRGEVVYVFMHNPLFHPNNPRVMGEKSKKVKRQALDLLKMFRNSPVKAIIAGDQHMFSLNQDKKSDLVHIVVGSLSQERNLQTPRFAVLTIFEGGVFEINEIAL